MDNKYCLETLVHPSPLVGTLISICEYAMQIVVSNIVVELQ